jgi:membrane fusion protein (multidrug efflux system)
MNRRPTHLSLLVLANLLACHPHERPHAEKAAYLVTRPLRQDTEITQEYVSQIRAIQHIDLRALERGYLQSVFVDEGQHVKRGQRMFQIMPMILQAELQKAQAEADFVGIEYANTKVLADGNIVSPNELALARAKLEKVNAELDLARVHRGLTEIKAPFDGIVGRFNVRLGSLVDEGELLTTLSDNSTLWVYFNVTEAEYLAYRSHVQDAEPQTVKLVMANGETFDQPGKVETIEADFNNETGNIAFRATFPNPADLLRHGGTGKILLTVPLPKALVIPQKATFEVLDKRYVFVIDEKGAVRTREISVAEEIPQLYVVAGGLTEQDKILVEGLRKVRDGQEIELNYQEPHEVIARLEVPSE